MPGHREEHSLNNIEKNPAQEDVWNQLKNTADNAGLEHNAAGRYESKGGSKYFQAYAKDGRVLQVRVSDHETRGAGEVLVRPGELGNEIHLTRTMNPEQYQAKLAYVKNRIAGHADSPKAINDDLSGMTKSDMTQEARRLGIPLKGMSADGLKDAIRQKRATVHHAEFRSFADEPTDFSRFDDPPKDKDPVTGIKPLPPEKAILYFQGLVPTLGVDPKRFPETQRRQAFTLAVATDETLLGKVQDLIGQRLATGKGIGKAPKEIDALLSEAGVTPKNPYYSQMAFRTNMKDSYTTGADEEMKTPLMKTWFPVWRYSGISDGRQRPSHAIHFGRYFQNDATFAEVRDSVKGEFDGYSCRCDPIPIDKNEWARLQSAGAEVSTFAEKFGGPGSGPRPGHTFTVESGGVLVAHNVDPNLVDHKPIEQQIAENDNTLKDAAARAKPMVGLIRSGQDLYHLPAPQYELKPDGRFQVYDGNARTIAYKAAGKNVPHAVIVDSKGEALSKLPADRHAELPDQRQDNGYQCGAAALQSALQAFGQTVSEDDLATELGTTREAGTPPQAIIAVARRRGLNVQDWQELGIAGLKAFTARGAVVLCPIQAHGNAAEYAALEGGHWIAVESVDDKVHYQDPTSGPETETPEEFLARWVDRAADGKTYVRYGIVVSK